MADGTKIEWTEATWNPIRARLRSDPSVVGWHCEHASPGCEHCYSEARNLSGRCNLGTKLPFKPGHRADVEVYLDEKVLLQPLRWRRGRMIFPCSMTDLFGAFVTDEMLDKIFAVMALCPQHTFQVLTKRSARMREYFADEWRWAMIEGAAQSIYAAKTGADPSLWLAVHDLPNVWLGVSVEDQQRADERRADFENTPAAVKFVSYEPALERVDWSGWEFVQQIISGGESGPKARPFHPDWSRETRDFCRPRGIAYFHKQNGEFAPGEIAGDYLDPEREAKGFSLFDGRWVEVWSAPEGHVDDEPDVYRIGKKRAGRLLDGVEHNGMPETLPCS